MRKKLLPIIILFPIIFILDIWIIGTISAFIHNPEALILFRNHPFRATGEIIMILFGKQATPAGLAVIKGWLIINILLISAAYITYQYIKTGFAAQQKLEFVDDIMGSARWATPDETKKIFNSHLSDPGLLFGTLNKKPLILPADTRGNLNVAVLGPPGSGKSRAYVRNNLFQAVTSGWSVVVTDPKGELTRDFRKYFESEGYQVRVFNLVNMLNSDRWNPLSQVVTDVDAQLFCEVVIANTGVPGKKGGDPFWDRAESNLLKALALYVVNENPPEARTIGSLYEILASGDSKYIDSIFATLPYDHPAKMPYNIYAETSAQVRSGVIIGLGTRLQVFQNALVRSLTEFSDIDLEEPGQRPCAYFCITSDMEKTFDFLASLFFSFLFINLTRYADRNNGSLPIMVNFLLDEFCNIGHIPDFTKKISTMRSRGIACSVIFQSLTQLESHYPQGDWETIMADCDTWLTLGVKDVTSAKYISNHLGVGTINVEARSRPVWGFEFGKKTIKPEKRNLANPDELIRMHPKQAILSVAHGMNPIKIKKMDYSTHPMSNNMEATPVSTYIPEWASEFLKTGGKKKVEYTPTVTVTTEGGDEPKETKEHKPKNKTSEKTTAKVTVTTTESEKSTVRKTPKPEEDATTEEESMTIEDILRIEDIMESEEQEEITEGIVGGGGFWG